MAFTTTTGAAVLTPDEVSALVIQPLIEQSVCTQVSTVLQTNSHQLSLDPWNSLRGGRRVNSENAF